MNFRNTLRLQVKRVGESELDEAAQRKKRLEMYVT